MEMLQPQDNRVHLTQEPSQEVTSAHQITEQALVLLKQLHLASVETPKTLHTEPVLETIHRIHQDQEV
jgi:hypothetical protein